MSRTTRLLAAAGTLAVSASVATGIAFAHAPVKTRLPKPGSTTSASVKKVYVSFGEAVITGKFVSVKRGGTTVPFTSSINARKTALSATFSKPLTAGTYTANWRVKADDGDTETGHWTFKVR